MGNFNLCFLLCMCNVTCIEIIANFAKFETYSHVSLGVLRLFFLMIACRY